MNYELLVKDIQEGNEEAYKLILDNFKKMICKLIHSYQSEIGDFKVDFDDIYQEACLSLYEACMTYKENQGMKFSSYAYLLIRSKVINRVRRFIRQYRGEYYSLDSYISIEYNKSLIATSVSENPVAYHNEIELKKMIDIFINELPKQDKEIINLRLDGHSYKVIADTLNITTKRVDNRLESIKKKLKKYMDDNNIKEDYLCG